MSKKAKISKMRALATVITKLEGFLSGCVVGVWGLWRSQKVKILILSKSCDGICRKIRFVGLFKVEGALLRSKFIIFER